MLIACLGSLLLIILAFKGVVSRGKWWCTFLITICVIVLWIFGINQFLPLQNSYPEAMTGQVARHAIEKFSQSPKTRYVFLIQGSSVTARGLNGDLLQKSLKDQGVSATVVQLSLDGANHVERLEILKEFVEGLSKSARASLLRSKVVFFQEVEAGYDRSPFNHVENNQFTDRMLAYINVRNLPEITRWLFARYGLKEIVQRRGLVGALVTHEIFNVLRVGYFQRLEHNKPLGIMPGYRPNEERRSDFHPEETLPPTVDLSHLKKEEKFFQKSNRWNGIRDRDFRRVLQGMIKKELFFSVPNWQHYDIAYDFWRSHHVGKALYFCGNSAPIRTVLSNPDLWSDPTHLKSAGANLYTEKLADFLLEKIRSGKL
jgi:hypothetical protein